MQDEKSWTLYLWSSSTFQIFEKSFSWQKINVFRPWKKIVVPGTFRPPKVEKTAFFGIFLRKEGLNQKIALRKLVLEFNFMANRTLKKLKIWIFKNFPHLAKFLTFFLKNLIFYFFRVLLAIKLNSKTYLRRAIFWFRPSFLKKMQKNAVFSTFGGLKVPIPKFFFHALKTFIFCQQKLFLKNF